LPIGPFVIKMLQMLEKKDICSTFAVNLDKIKIEKEQHFVKKLITITQIRNNKRDYD